MNTYTIDYNSSPKPLILAVGSGTNTFAYSNDGINWMGSGTDFFKGTNSTGSGIGYDAKWNGIQWVALGRCTTNSCPIMYSNGDLSVVPPVYNYSSYGTNWTKSYDLASTQSIAISSTGQYQTVILDDGNKIYTSSDYGATWNDRTTPDSENWRSLCVSSTGKYQSVGTIYHGTYYSNNNGATWIKSNMPNVFFVTSIAMSSNGEYQTLLTSTVGKWESNNSGIDWNQVSEGILPYRNYSSVGISDNGQYQSICVSDGYIYYTEDSGASWNQSNASYSRWGNIAVSSTGQYQVACGAPANVIYSSDYGKTWTASSLSSTSDYYALSMSKTTGQYLTLYKNTGMYYSNDYGKTWTADTNGFIGSAAVSSDGTYQVLAGTKNGMNPGIYYSQLPAVSSGGIIWQNATPSNIFTTQGNGVAWNGTRWVAVGEGTNTIAYSSDGTNWTGVVSNLFTTGYNIAWNGSLYVAVGTGTSNAIATSSDGINWTGRGSSMFGTTGTSIGYGVAWNGSLWVAVGSGTTSTIVYSSDGINWTGIGASIFSTSGYGRGIAWNGSRWVAVGSVTNTIAYSNDGINWTGLGTNYFATSSPVGYSVAWTGVRWIATGGGANGITNTIYYSPDGIIWTGAGSSIFSTGGYGIGIRPFDTVSLTNPNNALEIVSDSYYQNGYDNFVFSVKQ